MPSLYEINKALSDVIEQGFSVDEDTGELLFDETDLDGLNASLNEKLEACGLFIKEKQYLIDSMVEEKSALNKRQKALERKVEWMKRYVLENLPEGGFESARIRLSTRKSSRVVVTGTVPDKYMRKKTDAVPDLKEIRRFLKDNKTDWAKIETSESLQVS